MRFVHMFCHDLHEFHDVLSSDHDETQSGILRRLKKLLSRTQWRLVLSNMNSSGSYLVVTSSK